jgi:maleylacetoacetate isomerase
MEGKTMILFDYCRSSAAYRVRIALNLKGLSYQSVPINLLKGEQQQQHYKQVNPQGLVPALKVGEQLITQSLAIIEYLEECYVETTPLLPKDTFLRAQVRAFAQTIACDIHPLDNLRVLKYLVNELSVSEQQKMTWYHHWIIQGFTALEQIVASNNSQFCFGDQPTLADVVLVPQVFNANRFGVDMSAFPHLSRVAEHCQQQEAFAKAHPDQQADA